VAIKSKWPLEAMRSERRGSAGKAEGYSKGGICVTACAEVGHISEWGLFCGMRIMAEEFLRVGELLSRVFTLDDRRPGHHHICHRAKFEQSWTIRSRVIVI